MSARFVSSAPSLYPVDPVEAGHVFGSPLFERATVRVGESHTETIKAPRNSARTPYLTAVRRTGRPWTRSWISHDVLIRGVTPVFTTPTAPNRRFGADRSPSFGGPAPTHGVFA